MLHDPHKIPEPILVLSGLTYLIPSYIAFNQKRIYDFSTCIFLTFTTLGFHSTRSEYFFVIDVIAILNFLARIFYLSLRSSNYVLNIYILSVMYSLTSYFIGATYRIMSFDPDWNTQMFYHALMHLSTAYSAYLTIRGS